MLLAPALEAAKAGDGEPGIAPVPGVVMAREFRLEGPMLDRVKASWPDLAGITGVQLRKYSFEARDFRSRYADYGRKVREHYASQMKKLGWYPLISDDEGARQSAAYSSPDGKMLFGYQMDFRGISTSLVSGDVSLDKIPQLEHVVLKMLAPGKPVMSPEDQKVVQQANELVKQDRRDEAVTLLQNALRERPRAVIIRRQLAATYDKMGRTDEHVAELKTIVSIEPMSYIQRLEYARALYEKKKDLQSALFEFTQASALGPDQGTPRYFIGRIEEDLGKYEESLAAYRQAGELAPHWVSVPLRMGAIFLTQKQYGLAEASFRRALELDPKCEKAREGLERARRKDG